MTTQLPPAQLRSLAIAKIRFAQDAMHYAIEALDKSLSLERAANELQLAAMRGEEAARIIRQLRRTS